MAIVGQRVRTGLPATEVRRRATWACVSVTLQFPLGKVSCVNTCSACRDVPSSMFTAALLTSAEMGRHHLWGLAYVSRAGAPRGMLCSH